MLITIAGHNGFIGKSLSNYLIIKGHTIVKFNRDDFLNNRNDTKISDSDIVINLTGKPIIGRWTSKYKQEIYNSRINTTKKIVEIISKSVKKPKLFINASAIGIYSNSGIHDDYSNNYSENFISTLVSDWENEAKKAELYGVRTIITRFGIVLAKKGGAFPQMLKPFNYYVGGNIGTGEQYFSFIHIDDLLNAFNYVIDNSESNGIYNFVSPNHIKNKDFTKALSKKLNKSAYFNIPEWLLKLIYGEGASVLTDGQAVIPKRLIDSNFKFKYPDIENALNELLP
ncbi:MAG: TIGR01777 family protein [Bacteroidetes bacterium GWA2_30_7]|nr:MAG: TIGR01777 family protein [Bacteroidetes bacterium GWA2_30_7]